MVGNELYMWLISGHIFQAIWVTLEMFNSNWGWLNDSGNYLAIGLAPSPNAGVKEDMWDILSQIFDLGELSTVAIILLHQIWKLYIWKRFIEILLKQSPQFMEKELRAPGGRLFAEDHVVTEQQSPYRSQPLGPSLVSFPLFHNPDI